MSYPATKNASNFIDGDTHYWFIKEDDQELNKDEIDYINNLEPPNIIIHFQMFNRFTNTNVIPMFHLEDLIPPTIDLINQKHFGDTIYINAGFLNKMQLEQIDVSLFKSMNDDIQLIVFGCCVTMSSPTGNNSEDYFILRGSKILFDILKNEYPNKTIVYSDLTTVYPDKLLNNIPIGKNMPVQLKYTLGDYIYVVKEGKRHGPIPTIEKIRTIIHRITTQLYPSSSYRFDPEYSWADSQYQKIASHQSNAPGAPKDWVSWNVNRHLNFVIKEETNL